MLILIAGLIGFSGCGRETATRHDEDIHGGETGTVTLAAEGGGAAAGVKTEKAVKRAFSPAVHASGSVAFNQAAMAYVAARVSGRVEKVAVFGGEKVRSGQDLIWLYSPDFLAAQLEFLQAEDRVRRQAPDSGDGKIYVHVRDSAEAKLRLMGLGAADLSALREIGRPFDLLPVRAPFKGSVVDCAVVTGSSVAEGEKLLTVADLSRVWVMIDIFERDLGLVRPGVKAALRTEAYPSETFEGRLTFISDVLDTATRTAKGRLEAANPGGRLRPGMFAEVEFEPVSGISLLSVPESAVRRVEGRTIVFIPLGENSYAAREVRTGRVFKGYVEILSGVREGESVVTGGSFDLKAEMLKDTLEGGH